MFDETGRWKHDEIVEAIKDSIDYYTEKNGFVAATFHFSTPSIYPNIHTDPDVQAVRKLFIKLGFKPQKYDTVSNAFNLNQDFYIFTYDHCIQDYNYTLPVVDDLDTLATICEYIYDGKVMMLIETYDCDDPNIKKRMEMEAKYPFI